jgi:hypothetical protein
MIAIMMAFVIDHHLLDSINLCGSFLAVLGFMYMTYVFFHRRPLKWLLRVITPGLTGALILFPAGLLEYAYFVGFTELALRGGVLYALVGGMIGIFNGIFVNWPPSAKKPKPFSWWGCLIGVMVAFLVWFTAALVRNRTPTTAFVQGAILAATGGVAGGIWSFINWGPLVSTEKLPSLSWRGCLIGLISAFVLGFVIYLVLGFTPVEGLIRSCILALTGGIVGSLVHFFKEAPFPSAEKPLLFSWRGCLIGLISAFVLGFVSALIINITFGVTLARSLGGALTAASFIGPAGAITGGISPYIFWKANELDDGKLTGIGATLTLIGFLIQLLPQFMNLFDISVSH